MSGIADTSIASDVGAARRAGTGILMLRCPVCRSDRAETLGVTSQPMGSSDASVVLRCADCGVVYLSPAQPADPGTPPDPEDAAALASQLRRWIPGGKRPERTLVIGRESDLPEAGCHDVILLPWSLESASDPNALLGRVCGLLSEDGRAVVVASNADSSCFSVFGSRHWRGYQRPGTRQQLTPAGIVRLAENAALRVRRLRSCFASDFWLSSTAAWLQDWGASRAIMGFLTGPWLVPQGAVALLETIAAARGRAALLIAELQRQ